MALTPIPLAKNWYDVYGSQSAPEATASKIPAPVYTASLNQATRVATITPTIAGRIDWGDGSARASIPASATTHTYASKGQYRVRVYHATYDDCFTDYSARFTDDPATTFSGAGTGTANEVELTIVNGVYPIVVKWGDALANTLVANPSPPKPKHLYGSAGTKAVQLYDSRGVTISGNVTAA
jgi:hypothetical protein